MTTINDYETDARAFVKLDQGNGPVRVAWIDRDGRISSASLNVGVFELPRVDPANLNLIAPDFEQTVAALEKIYGPAFAARWATGEVGAAFSDHFADPPSFHAVSGLTGMVE